MHKLSKTPVPKTTGWTPKTHQSLAKDQDQHYSTRMQERAEQVRDAATAHSIPASTLRWVRRIMEKLQAAVTGACRTPWPAVAYPHGPLLRANVELVLRAWSARPLALRAAITGEGRARRRISAAIPRQHRPCAFFLKISTMYHLHLALSRWTNLHYTGIHCIL